MYIKLLEYDTVEFIRNNVKTIHNHLENSSLIEIIESNLGIGWFKQSKIIKPDFNLYIDNNVNPKSTDSQNAIEIYESFKNLTESQASDERLWAGLSIENDVFSYLKYRWKDTVNTLKYRVVFHVQGKRGIMYHGIARLWWFAHITYDEYRDNHYELTNFAFNYPHILEKMIYRNFSNSKSIRIGIIEGIKQYIEEDGVYKINKIDELYKYISILGSVSLVDNFEKEEIKDLTVKFLENF